MEWRTWCILVVLYIAQVFRLQNGHISAPAQLTDKAMSCDRGWYTFGDKCYKLGGNKKFISFNWIKASEYCKDNGGTLATVSSKEISEIRRRVWIGLNDMKSEGEFVWEDGTPLGFTNWAPGEPSHNASGLDEDCVDMRFVSSIWLGEWRDVNCLDYEMPFICQKDKTETAVIRAPLDPKFCSEENNSGWKFRTSCFNLVTEKKTWQEAEDYCREYYSGQLATLRDVTYDIFIDYMLRNVVGDVWIGIEIEESSTQQWTSGWFVGYSGWERDKNDFVEGTCVSRSRIGDWNTDSCKRKFAFVCESTTDEPPVLTQSVKESVCPEDFADWKDLGGDMCYFFEFERQVSWFEASFMCLQRGGSLVSIHSQEEVDVLHQFVLFTKEYLHIGLHRKKLETREFVWSDGTPFDFRNWDSGEPDRDVELCSVISTINMKFHNFMCDGRKGYICSVRKVVKLTASSPTAATPEACSTSVSISTLVGVIVGIFVVEGVMAAIWIYYFKFLKRGAPESRKSSIKHVKRFSSLSNSPKFKKDCNNDVAPEGDYYEPMT